MANKPTGDDVLLIEACINRDASAWTEFVKKYSDLISASIVNRLKKYGFDPLVEEVEDIRQNVLTSIWADGLLGSIRNRRSAACWLAVVSGNMAILHMRRKMPGKGRSLVPLQDECAIEATENGKSDSDELSEAIERAMSRLPGDERLTAKLSLVHGMAYHEISDMLKIPMGTVASRISRAKEKLKESLKDFE